MKRICCVVSERSAKRVRVKDSSRSLPDIQTTLGFSFEHDDNQALLRRVLAFVANSKDLVRTRQVCRAFRRCSDEVARKVIDCLVGPNIEPVIDQSVVGLLHAAEQADDFTRRYLMEWDSSIRAEGFDVGLRINGEEECERFKTYILALVPCDPMSPGAKLPVALFLDRFRFTRAKLPRGFFHMNAYVSGVLEICALKKEYLKEKNLNDSLRRIKSDIMSKDPECPHCILPFWIYAGIKASHLSTPNTELYKEYQLICMDLYRGYKLGKEVPKLNVFQKLVAKELELMKAKKTVEESIVSTVTRV